MKLDERSVALPTVYRYTGSKSLDMGELFLTWLLRDIYNSRLNGNYSPQDLEGWKSVEVRADGHLSGVADTRSTHT